MSRFTDDQGYRVVMVANRMYRVRFIGTYQGLDDYGVVTPQMHAEHSTREMVYRLDTRKAKWTDAFGTPPADVQHAISKFRSLEFLDALTECERDGDPHQNDGNDRCSRCGIDLT